MKKLAKFLSLGLLTISCCFSAHAIIKDKPATPEQHQQFIQDMKEFAEQYATKNGTTDFSSAERNTEILDDEKKMKTRTARVANILYAAAIKQNQILSCRACASFALLELEKRKIQCGYVQGYFDHLQPVRPRFRGVTLTPLSINDSWHDTIIYSVKDASGTHHKWYVCDMQLALPSVCAEFNKKRPTGIGPFIRPKGTDYTYFFAIPLEEYIKKFAIFKTPDYDIIDASAYKPGNDFKMGDKDIITVRKDESRNEVLCGDAIQLAIVEKCVYYCITSNHHISLRKWLKQANAVSMGLI